MIAKQAKELMDRLPGEVSASEYSLVGFANSNLPEGASKLFDMAIDTADNANGKVSAEWGKAALLMTKGDLEGGRAVFEQALRIFDEYLTGSRYYEHMTHIDTHLYWAGADYSQGQCDEVRIHLEAAGQHAAQLILEPLTAQKIQQIEGAANLSSVCMPGSGVPQTSLVKLPGMGTAAP